MTPLFLVSALSAIGVRVHAYIPASPTNNTNAAIQQGLNVSDVSKLKLQWYPDGSLWENVSYQLVGAESTGVSQGVLVHFSEDMVTNDTTYTPWIALVGCDANATNASQQVDIFTLARNAGAEAAVLYSIYSQECIINPAYADPATFDQVMYIFSTESLTSANLIEYQFGQFGAVNESIYGSFNAHKLNQSGAAINKSLATNNPASPGYIYATLTAYNATGTSNNNTSSEGNNNDSSTSGDSGDSTNTGLAMIILYAITGCVSALFCVVIISGAVRAIRHPERYGPRRRMDGGIGLGQSRARGLTRAILDTFPVVKFGSATEAHDPDAIDSIGNVKDVEARPDSYGPRDSTMDEWEVMDIPLEMIERGDGREQRDSVASHLGSGGVAEVENNDPEDGQPRASGSRLSATPSPLANITEGSSTLQPPPAPVNTEDVVPAAIGRETCPICIVDFEEGDDLRLLPCEGKHRFHQECVDPWLLELSSSCPICRHDFLALETMMAGEVDDVSQIPQGMDHPPVHMLNGNGNGSPTQTHGRFSRYLRFARRRQNRRDAQIEIREHEPENVHGHGHEHTDISSGSDSPGNSV